MGNFHRTRTAREPIGGSDAGRLNGLPQCCSGSIVLIYGKNK